MTTTSVLSGKEGILLALGDVFIQGQTLDFPLALVKLVTLHGEIITRETERKLHSKLTAKRNKVMKWTYQNKFKRQEKVQW